MTVFRIAAWVLWAATLATAAMSHDLERWLALEWPSVAAGEALDTWLRWAAIGALGIVGAMVAGAVAERLDRCRWTPLWGPFVAAALLGWWLTLASFGPAWPEPAWAQAAWAAALAVVAQSVTSVGGWSAWRDAALAPSASWIAWSAVPLGLALVAGAILAQQQPASARRDNVVFVLVDSLRADVVGALGAQSSWTPELDEIAAHGRVYERAYAASAWPYASLGALMTSTMPHVFGAAEQPQGRSADALRTHATIAEYFRAHGHRTHAIDAGIPGLDAWGLDVGFATADRRPGADQAWAVERSQQFLAGVADPFFLLVGLSDPAPPWQLEIHMPEATSYTGPRQTENLNSVQLAATAMTPDDRALLRRIYEDDVRVADRALGAIWGQIQARADRDRTWLVVAAPTGLAFAERRRNWIGYGQHLHEELIRVPLIVVGPGVEAGRERDRPVALVDLLPTMASAFGWKLKEDQWRTGRPLPLRSVTEPTGLKPVFAETRFGDRWLRSAVLGPAKLIRDLVTNEVWLYDLSSDPGEQRNVAAGNLPLVRDLVWELNAWVADLNLAYFWAAERPPRVAPTDRP